MSEGKVFRLYAKEAMCDASTAVDDSEKRALEELAVIWAQASLMSDRVLGSSFTPSPQAISEYTLENTPIRARSECPKCGMPMYVARIVPDESGLDRRYFECPRCQHVETTVVTCW
jgi:hypothetical protein